MKKPIRQKSNANRNVPSGTLMQLVQELMDELNTPRSMKMKELLISSNFKDAILTEGVNPREYSNTEEFRRDYLATEILSKYPIDIGIDRDQVAIEAFLLSEDHCAETNDRFSPVGIRNWSFETRSILEIARVKIEAILGPFNWDDVAKHFNFGPGATTSMSRRLASTENKLKYGIACTPNALGLATTVWDYFPGWKAELDSIHSVRPKVVQGSRIITVPKNAKTSRVIAIEPDLNMFLQKGFGQAIRVRLRKAGLDLNTAWKKNHELAKIGSVFNSYATIDLKAASDTISKRLVEFLLPEPWFDALSMCRSRQAVLPSGDWVSLQKFSSMGNGFTFELESMIFYALSLAVIDHHRLERRITVFGDDIIVPVKAYDGVVSILAHCGFTVNEKKTFQDGPFRESCGKHYFKGFDVTPFYLREQTDDTLTLIRILNRCKEWSIHPVYGLDGLYRTYSKFKEYLPRRSRNPCIPFGYGDSALWGDFDEVLPQRAPRGMEGWMVNGLLPSTRRKPGITAFSVLASLWGLERRVLKEISSMPTQSVFADSYRYGRFLVTQWPNNGPWIEDVSPPSQVRWVSIPCGSGEH